MKIKLLKDVLVGDADVMPTLKGNIVEMDDGKAKEFIKNGLAEESGEKQAAEPANKMAQAPKNKAK